MPARTVTWNRMRRQARSALVPASVGVLALTASLAACTGTTPTPDSSPTSTTASPAPTASADGLVIPDCEQLVPIEQIQAYEPWRGVVLIQSMEGPGLGDVVTGPVAGRVAGSAQQARGCLLGVPQSDAGLAVYTLEIPDAARDDLIDELRADDAFTEISVGGAPTFVIATEAGLGASTVSYTFGENAWIVLSGNLIDLETVPLVAESVLAALVTANP